MATTPSCWTRELLPPLPLLAGIIQYGCASSACPEGSSSCGTRHWEGSRAPEEPCVLLTCALCYRSVQSSVARSQGGPHIIRVIAIRNLSCCRYGAYEISNDPGFSRNELSLIDRGFVYAIAHVRGGGELGRQWYEVRCSLAQTVFCCVKGKLAASGMLQTGLVTYQTYLSETLVGLCCSFDKSCARK